MNHELEDRPLWLPGLLVVGLLVVVGTTWAFQRGANDFQVFYDSWRQVLAGNGARVYGSTSDRFLYAPGFAWLLSPLGALDRDLALALWCFFKAAGLGLLLRILADRVGGLAFALGTLTVARPLLIDFQYGQVNLLILAACAWALFGHGSRQNRADAWDFVRWMVLAFAAVAKVFPLPLLAIPFLSTRGVPPARLKLERAGAVAGVLLIALLPAVSVGLSGLPALHDAWRSALLDRGLPIETHNQSVIASLMRYFGSDPTHMIALAYQPIPLGLGWIPREAFRWISLVWTVAALGIAGALILTGPWVKRPYAVWAAVCMAALIVPSHLVWKPYFVMTLPVAAVAWRKAVLELKDSRITRLCLAALGLALINLTGFDLVGYAAAARFEAASAFMIAHLLFMGLALWRRRAQPAA